MIKGLKKSLNDTSEPLLGPNLWILKITGLIVPSNYILKLFYLFNQFLVTIFICTQWVEVWIIRSDLNLVLNNIKVSILSVVCIVKANTFVMSQDKWLDLFDYITKSDITEREIDDPFIQKIVKSYTKYSRKITFAYWFLAFSNISTMICMPIATFLFTSNYRQKMNEGLLPFPHILSAWVPFDKNSSPECWFLVCWHFQLCIYGGFIMASYDAAMLVIMTFFGKKLEMLHYKCLNMFRGDVTEDAFNTIIKQYRHDYMLLQKNVKLFNSLLSSVMFFYVIICSLYLCASAIELSKANTTMERLLGTEYLLFGVAQLFIFCWHATVVYYKSLDISMGVYNSEWYKLNKRQQKIILALTGQFQERIIFAAGPFANLSLSTFITILKGAYSYYTLLRK